MTINSHRLVCGIKLSWKDMFHAIFTYDLDYGISRERIYETIIYAENHLFPEKIKRKIHINSVSWADFVISNLVKKTKPDYDEDIYIKKCDDLKFSTENFLNSLYPECITSMIMSSFSNELSNSDEVYFMETLRDNVFINIIFYGQIGYLEVTSIPHDISDEFGFFLLGKSISIGYDLDGKDEFSEIVSFDKNKIEKECAKYFPDKPVKYYQIPDECSCC